MMIKAISIRNPWPWLIFHGGKRVENRTWRTKYRGPLLICSSSETKEVAAAVEWAFDVLGVKCPPLEKHPRGKIMGIVNLVDCVRVQDLPDELRDDFAEGPICHVYEDAKAFKDPVPVKGRLSLFDVDLAEVAGELRKIGIDPLSLVKDSPGRLVIKFPLPDPYLHPNRKPGTKKGGIVRSRIRKQTRDIAMLTTIEAMRRREDYGFPWKEATIQATYHLPRKRDDDGLISWMKAVRDGIQDAGVIKNDSGFKVVPVQQVTDRSNPKLVVTIEKVA